MPFDIGFPGGGSASPSGALVLPGVVVGSYYAPAPSAAPAAAAMSRSIIYFIPLFLPACTVDRIALNVTSAVASTTLRMGIYRDNGNGVPSVLGVDGGTVDPTTNGLKEVTVNYVHATGGLLWLACQMTGGASNPSVTSQTTFNQYLYNLSATAQAYITGGVMGYFVSNTGVFPDPVVPTNDTTGPIPRMAIRIAT